MAAVLQAERDGLKSTVEMQLTLISDLQTSVSQKTNELSAANEQVLSTVTVWQLLSVKYLLVIIAVILNFFLFSVDVR